MRRARTDRPSPVRDEVEPTPSRSRAPTGCRLGTRPGRPTAPRCRDVDVVTNVRERWPSLAAMPMTKTEPATVIARLKEELRPARGLTTSFDPRPDEQLGHTIWHLECDVAVADGTPPDVVDRGMETIERVAKEFGGCIAPLKVFPPVGYPNPEKPIQRFWIIVIWESLR
jgi:hypothetical protein